MTLGIPNPSEFRKLLNKLDGRYESTLSESEIVSIRPIAIVGSLSAWANNGADMPFEPEQAKGRRSKYPQIPREEVQDEGIEVPELLAPFSEEEIHSMIAMAEERGATMEQFFQIADELGSVGVCEFLELDEGAFGRALSGAALGGAVGGPIGALAGAGLAMMRPIKTAHGMLKLGQAYHAYGMSKEQHRAAKLKAELKTVKAKSKLNKRKQRDTEVAPVEKVKKVGDKTRVPRRAKDVLARLERMKASKAARATTLPGATAIPGTKPFSRGGSAGGTAIPRPTSRSRQPTVKARAQSTIRVPRPMSRSGSAP